MATSFDLCLRLQTLSESFLACDWFVPRFHPTCINPLLSSTLSRTAYLGWCDSPSPHHPSTPANLLMFPPLLYVPSSSQCSARCSDFLLLHDLYGLAPSTRTFPSGGSIFFLQGNKKKEIPPVFQFPPGVTIFHSVPSGGMYFPHFFFF